jgi:hypothetical protein
LVSLEFISELESIFRHNFIQAAPLYTASGKFKLPYEDIKKTTSMYRGSLTEVVRKVDEFADWEMAPKTGFTPEFARTTVSKLATQAGVVIDGFIRLENVRNHRDHDPRNTTDMKVVDIFDHSDGRRNLQIIGMDSKGNGFNPADPFTEIPGWIAYRFYFAAAVVSSEYRGVKNGNS